MYRSLPVLLLMTGTTAASSPSTATTLLSSLPNFNFNLSDMFKLGDSGSSPEENANQVVQVYQDPFCLGYEKSNISQNDTRFAIHSFAILHGRLYIMSATAVYNVSLDEAGPPYAISKSLHYTDFSNHLSSMLYSTPYVTTRLFTSVGIELDSDRELLVIGYKVSTSYSNPYNPTDLGNIRFTEMWRDSYILRNRNRHYQPSPASFEYEFSSSLSDDAFSIASDLDGDGRPDIQLAMNSSRFICASGYFYHVVIKNATVHNLFYIYQYTVAPALNFTITEYYLFQYKSTSNKWLLSNSAKADQAQYVRIRIASEAPFVKNGYINKKRMYLADWAQRTIEVYNISDSTDFIEVTLTEVMPAQKLITCDPTNPARSYFTFAVIVSLVVLFGVCCYLIGEKVHPRVCHRCLLGPNMALYPITQDNIFSKKAQ